MFVQVRACVMVSCGVVLLSFMWTMMPLLGWNEYTMEVGRTSCCIDWYSRRPSYLSFTVVIFVFVYCVPLVILVVTNSITLHGLQRMHEKIERGLRAGFNRRRIEMERRILKSESIGSSAWRSFVLSRRYHDNHVRFLHHLDTVCGVCTNHDVSRSRARHTADRHVDRVDLRQVLGRVDSAALHLHIDSVSPASGQSERHQSARLVE